MSVLGRKNLSLSRKAALLEQIRAQVEGMDPLARPAGGRALLAGDWHGDAAWASQIVAQAGAEGLPLVLQLVLQLHLV